MIAATSWFLITLMGLGFVTAFATAGRRILLAEARAPALATALMYGMLADHALGLIFGPNAQTAAAWAGGLMMIAWLAMREQQPASWKSWILPWAIVGVVALAAAAQPMLDWDARSIWFFHAKVIFFDQGAHPSAFWSNGFYDWSHKEYPILIPMLAARFAAFAGHWNEFVPRGALTPLAASGLLGLAAISRGAVFPILCAGVVVLSGRYLWDGYMDAWLAVHGVVAVAAGERWRTGGDRLDLLLAAGALAMCLCLKNEGQLLLLTTSPLLALGLWRQRNMVTPRDMIALTAVVPFFLWRGIAPGLPAAGPGAAALLSAAGHAAEPLSRLGYLFMTTARLPLLPLAAAFLVVGVCAGWRKFAVAAGLIAMLYCAGLAAVYLGAGADFTWLVDNSLNRVLLLPEMLLFAGLAAMVPAVVTAVRGALPLPVTSSNSP